MEKINYHFYLMILVYLIITSSCQKHNIVEKVNFNIERLESMTYKFDDVFILNRIIILEETDSSLLSTISCIKNYNNCLYVSDNQSNSIFRFSGSGKYINRIGKRGRGPGEFQILMDFVVNDSGVWIMDLSNKVVLYGHDGTLIKEYSKPAVSFGFIQTDDKYLFYNINYQQWSQIIIKDSLFRTIKEFSPLRYQPFVMPMAGKSYLFRDKTDIFITYPFSDTIYKIIDSTVVPSFIFGFEQRKLTNFKSLYGGNFNGDLSKYDYSFKDFLTPKYFVSNLALDNKSKLLIYNRMNNDNILIDSISDGPNLVKGAQLYQVDEEGIFYWGYDRTANKPGFESLFKGKKLNDNPVLILTSLKK